MAKSARVEPLIEDVRQYTIDPLNAQFGLSAEHQPALGDPPFELITDETICRQAAQAYFDNTQFEDVPLGAVLVIKVGKAYLVDNLRPRAPIGELTIDDDCCYWVVKIFNDQWEEVAIGYGDGA